MKHLFVLLFMPLIGLPTDAWGQLRITGRVVDAENKQPLPYVNIGIKQENIGTVTALDGSYLLDIPKTHANDTLSFSLVGYDEYDFALEAFENGEQQDIHLVRKNRILDEVAVSARKPVERRFGIKRRNLLIHFADGMFNQDDSFEIGQLIKLGDTPVKLTAIKLYVLTSRADSATFRINFYRYRDGRPAERAVEKSMVQRHAIKKGWMRFDLADNDIRLSGEVIATLEFMPEPDETTTPIGYEVKLGGTSKSFYRRSSLGNWNTPPHHYCLHVTALVNQEAPAPPDEDLEAAPTFVFPSRIANDRFSVFVNLPQDYERDPSKRYPVLFHLDGNAYFDHVKDAVAKYGSEQQNSTQPIVVGIGYENAYLMDSLRVRDYTFPEALPADSFMTSGGADRFYAFITEELIPYIDSCYRTETTSRTIMGHSFGGYFVLYALLREYNAKDSPHLQFDHYVSASPSIGYRDGYIVQQLALLLENAPPYRIGRQNLYLTMGERELDHGSAPLFTKLTEILNKQQGIRLETKLYRNTEHMGTAVPSFEDAIPFIDKYSRPPLR